MGTMNSWILSIKVVLVSAGVLSLAMGLKFTIPVALNGAPALWTIISSCIKPPYLYILINGIIITIVASSRFHHSQTEPAAAVRSDHFIAVKTPQAEAFESLSDTALVNTAAPQPAREVGIEDRVVDLKPMVVNRSKVDFAAQVDDLIRAEAENVFDEINLPFNSPLYERISPEVQLESIFPAREKPLASSRFVHKKPTKISPEVGGARMLRRVARPKKQDTLESTWKMITEGRHVPLTRHLKKSETFEHQAPPAMAHVVPKSETFKERSNYESPAPAKIPKEPSLGQDDLNRRVEAFIHKFNEDMRIQRQESHNQFMEMISRGV